MSIKVLIADDIACVRKLEKTAFETDVEIELVGEAADAPEAIRLAGALKPDVIVMDVRMPEDGFTATHVVKARRPQVKVLAITADLELYGPDFVRELGADALLRKTSIGQELTATIKRLVRVVA
jgi:DNA-binding NarL/FixJ family response regulator